MDNKCRFCGADKQFCNPIYMGMARNVQCYERQIAQLTERLENMEGHYQELENMHHQCCKDNGALKERLEAWREWHSTLGLIEHKYGLHKDGERTIDKLKALGEIK